MLCLTVVLNGLMEHTLRHKSDYHPHRCIYPKQEIDELSELTCLYLILLMGLTHLADLHET